MAWIYELSKFNRRFKIAPEKFGAKISGNRLYFYNSNMPKGIEISKIVFIDFLLRQTSEADYYCYVVKMLNGKEIELSDKLLEGKEYQRLIKDIRTLNPSISLSESVDSFIKREIPLKPRIMWDFNVYNKRERLNFLQDFPSLAAYIQIKILVAAILFNVILIVSGLYLLKTKFGLNYSSLRIYSLIASGILFSVSLINIYGARFRLYRGHKLTISTMIISISLIVLSFIKF